MSNAFDILKGRQNQSSNDFKRTLLIIFRWIIVLPVFFIVLLLGRLLSESWLRPIHLHEYGYVLGAFFVPGWAILSAAYTAPKGKFVLSVVLATFLVLVNLFMLLIVIVSIGKILSGQPHKKEMLDIILSAFSMIIAIFTVIRACIEVKKEEDEMQVKKLSEELNLFENE